MNKSSMSRKWKDRRSSGVNAGSGERVHTVGHDGTLRAVEGSPGAEERCLGREIDPRGKEQRCGLAVGWLLNGIPAGRARELIDRSAVQRWAGPRVHFSASRASAPDRRHYTAYRRRGLDG